MDDEMKDRKTTEESNDLLAHLEECEEMCLLSQMYSLRQGGDFAERSHMRWLMDCADICSITKKFYIRDSEYAGDLLNICAYVCDDCAESCEKFFEDEHMKNCAKVCRDCAEKCEEAIEVDEEEEPE